MSKDDRRPHQEEVGRQNVWTDECEALLAEWSEKASCYRWLHGRCEKSYRKWYYCFSIPVIILSTLTGAANVGMDSFVPAESKSIASAIVGGVNIFAGIVSTLQNFLKVAELMEGHRIAGISWGKLQRNIAIELALDPSRRVLQNDFLKISRSEYDRLIEAGPIIDDGVIKQFNKKFSNYEVSVPSICNGLDKCNIYKIDKTVTPNNDEFKEGIEDLISDEEKEKEKDISKLSIVHKALTDATTIKINIDENIVDDKIVDDTKTHLPDGDLENLIPSSETNDKITQTLGLINDTEGLKEEIKETDETDETVETDETDETEEDLTSIFVEGKK